MTYHPHSMINLSWFFEETGGAIPYRIYLDLLCQTFTILPLSNVRNSVGTMFTAENVPEDPYPYACSNKFTVNRKHGLRWIFPIVKNWITANNQWCLVQNIKNRQLYWWPNAIVVTKTRWNKQNRPAGYPGIWYSSDIGMQSFLHLR